jgi:hypothetical protein
MAYTTDHVAALEQAIATGALTVRNANGEFVTYRSLAEMRSVLAEMRRATTAPLNRGPRAAQVHFGRD